jgi:hypothetical protein
MRLLPPESQAEMEVTAAISNLSNTVIAAKASRSLAKYVPNPVPLTFLLIRMQAKVPARISRRILLRTHVLSCAAHDLDVAVPSARAALHL